MKCYEKFSLFCLPVRPEWEGEGKLFAKDMNKGVNRPSVKWQRQDERQNLGMGLGSIWSGKWSGKCLPMGPI